MGLGPPRREERLPQSPGRLYGTSGDNEVSLTDCPLTVPKARHTVLRVGSWEIQVARSMEVFEP